MKYSLFLHLIHVYTSYCLLIFFTSTELWAISHYFDWVLAGSIIIALILQVFIPDPQWTVGNALSGEMRVLEDAPGFATCQASRQSWKCRPRCQRGLELEIGRQREVIFKLWVWTRSLRETGTANRRREPRTGSWTPAHGQRGQDCQVSTGGGRGLGGDERAWSRGHSVAALKRARTFKDIMVHRVRHSSEV